LLEDVVVAQTTLLLVLENQRRPATETGVSRFAGIVVPLPLLFDQAFFFLAHVALLLASAHDATFADSRVKLAVNL